MSDRSVDRFPNDRVGSSDVSAEVKPRADRPWTSGTSTVEMALIVPFLLLLLLGIVDLSVLLHDKVVITNASREGARFGITVVGGYPTDTDIEQHVNNYLQNHLISFQPSSAVTTTTRSGTTPGSDLSVRVAYQYSFLALPGFVSSLTSPLTIGAETTMHLE